MLKENEKKLIQQSYSQYLNELELSPRQGQKEMIGHIARSLGGAIDDGDVNGAVSIIEAGTGTGKTVAYCLSAIPMALKREKKLIISTATIALQEQIIYKDLPAVQKYSGLEFKFELAKGRGRYLCPVQLDLQLAQADPSQGSLGLYPDEIDGKPSQEQRALLEGLRKGFKEDGWQGDRDSWPVTIHDLDWRRVTTDHARCTGRRCEQIHSCPFFKARESLDQADVVVANHDLVLADLALGGGAILSKPEESIYVFDEGHHLPDKALDHFASMSKLRATSKWLNSLEKNLPQTLMLASRLGLATGAVAELPSLVIEAKQGVDRFEALLIDTIEVPVMERDELPRYRFPNGMLGDDIHNSVTELSQIYTRFLTWLNRLNNSLEDGLEIASSKDERQEVEQSLSGIAAVVSRAEEQNALWQSWAKLDDPNFAPNARWITWLNDGDMLLCCSPILASGTLKSQLWQRCYGAVVTSATLSALGTFDRFRMRAGTDINDSYASVSSPFDFANVAELCIPVESVDPSDKKAFDRLMDEDLSNLIDVTEATLILFTARRHMEQFYDGLTKEMLSITNYQGQYSRSKVIEEHKNRVDAGGGSILLGLASFAEGLDLPGDYCKTVVLVKLPFAVPDAPVEAQLAEWIESQGGNPFMQITVPDASLKLIQSCGRLIRSENDTGRILLLDKRVVTKRYGHQLLNSLPPYRRKIEAVR